MPTTHFALRKRVIKINLEIINKMKVIDKNGNVLIDKEMQSKNRGRMSSLRVMRHTKGVKKTVTPVVMSKELFFNTVIPQTNGNIQ